MYMHTGKSRPALEGVRYCMNFFFSVTLHEVED
jgi:hypothetical protein